MTEPIKSIDGKSLILDLENDFLSFGSPDGDGDVGVGQLRQELVSAGLQVGRLAEKVPDDGAAHHLGHNAKPGRKTKVEVISNVLKEGLSPNTST